jgi:putative membrane protein
VKRMGIVTAAGTALIWTASLATPSLAQTAGTAGAPGSQAGSGERPGTQGPSQPGTHDPGAQGGIGTTTEAADVRAESNPADRAARDRQEFFERAAIANMAEVRFGQLGAERAQDPQVKAFAEKVVQEHTNALEQLRSLASAQGVELPSELDRKHQRTHEKLSEAEAEKFDRAFMKAMVDTHKNTEKLLRKRAGQQAAQQTASATGTAAADLPASGATGSTGSDARDEAGEDVASAAGQVETPDETTPSTAGDAPSAVGTSGMATPASAEQWAAMMLPKVQAHLEQARALEDQVKNAERRGGNDSDRDQQGDSRQQ